MLAEGAAAVAMAGVLAEPRRFANRNVVAIVCGGNVSRETLKKVL
jgi:threonine dehydratase